MPMSGDTTLSPVEVEFADFNDAREVWDALATRLGASPFARPAWIEPWWDAFGTGAAKLALSRRDGELTGVMPLMRNGSGRLRACANAHTPRFEALGVADEDLDALLLAALAESGRGIVLTRVDIEGPLAAAAARLAIRGDCIVRHFDQMVGSRIGPGLGWEEFEAALPSSRKRANRRRLRGLEKIGEVGWQTFSDYDEEAFGHFLRLEASPWKVDRGTAIRQSRVLVDFYREAWRRGGAAGILRLRFLTLDSEPVGVQLVMEDPVRRWAMKVGFDPELSRYSPGVLQLLDETEAALEAGRSLELGTGDEPLKEEFRTGTWTSGSLAIFHRSISGYTAATATATGRRAYERARGSRGLRQARDRVRNFRARRRVDT
jgi:CelD/BcsL family acetyltransferase involved in cellulose biosynthesis